MPGCLANRVKKENQGGKSLSILLPDRATIPATRADRCRQLWADAAMRLVMGGGGLVGRGEESNWAMPLAAHILGWGKTERARETGVFPFQSRCGETKRKAARRGGEPVGG